MRSFPYEMKMEFPFDTVEREQTCFKHPFTMTVSGSTGSGKSEWVKRFLSNIHRLVNEQISLILYCYGELNSNIVQMQRKGTIGGVKVQVHSGLPVEEHVRKLAQSQDGVLLVLDDLMVGMDQKLLDTLFTRGSHNWGVSVVLITQHLFSKELRIARNNSHYLVLLRNPAGALQTRTLATHLFPRHSAFFMDAFADATKTLFGYLLVDMHPSTPEKLRLRTHIYTDEEKPVTVYLPT